MNRPNTTTADQPTYPERPCERIARLESENRSLHEALDFLIDTQGDHMTTEEWETYDALIAGEEE